MIEKLWGFLAMAGSLAALMVIEAVELHFIITLPLVFGCVCAYLIGTIFLFNEGRIIERKKG